jgi:nucleoid-associated protein YgaU
MTDANSLQVRSLAQTDLEAVAVSPKVAIGVQLATLQMVATMVVDESAPRFPPGVQPVADGQAYPAVDGRQLYRPELRVGRRPASPGPDVWLLRDAEENVRLQFSLEEASPAALAPGAVPFPVRVDGLAVVWSGGRLEVPSPLIEAAAGPGDTDPAFVVRGGVVVPPAVLPALEAAMRTDQFCHLEVTLSYGYWAQEPPRPDPNHPQIPRWPPRGGSIPPWKVPIGGRWSGRDRVLARAAEPFAVAEPMLMRREGMDATPIGEAEPAAADEIASAAVADPNMVSMMKVLDPGQFKSIMVAARWREQQAAFRRVSFVRSLGFRFDPGDPANQSIYRGLRPLEMVGESWKDSGSGMIRESGFPNTLFRVPDEVRFAFAPRLGTPFLVPTLYQDATGANRVRVLLRALPWHDPRQLSQLRELLHGAPRVAVGGYESATLTLTTAFPEQIVVLGAGAGNTVPVSIERGFELTLDVTVEFYQYLASVLTGAAGITGEVAVTLARPAGADGQPQPAMVKRVGVRLALSDPAALPTTVTVPPDAVSPRKVTVVNTAGVAVRIGGCTPWLLQLDPNSVAAIDVHKGRCTTSFPVELDPDESVELTVEPTRADVLLWNAVELELFDHVPATDPRAVLEHVHELAPAAAYVWRIQVSCPVLEQPPVPAKWADLSRVEVEIWTEGFDKQEAVLSRDAPASQITMRRRLADVMRDDLQGLSAFRYRKRNVYVDRIGAWSPEDTEEGSHLFAFPNDATTDRPNPAPNPGPGTGTGTGPRPADRTYEVRAGDTLWMIASRELGDGNRWREIAQLNNVSDPNALRPGLRLRLPR